MEDHDEALKIWRQHGVRGLDLIHIDAHIDCAYQHAKPIQEVFAQAKSVHELKQQLEYSLSFLHYENRLSRQTDIGNYIYPAMVQGMIRDFYWVVPGDEAEFRRSLPSLKRQLAGIARAQDREARLDFACPSPGSLKAKVFGRSFQVCTLDALPVFRSKVLLDIDTDFLVIDSVRRCANTDCIGRRKPWLSSEQLCRKIRDRIKAPEVTTIAYSTNGGWTPMRYRHLADEIASRLAPARFQARLNRAQEAARLFADFEATGRRASYAQAGRFVARYRMPDNSLGPLYLLKGRPRRAEAEFRKILRVDPRNPGALWGSANIAMSRRRFAAARSLLERALREAPKHKMFAPVMPCLHFALAKTCAEMKDLPKAEHLVRACLRRTPLDGQARALLGRVCERLGKPEQAAVAYQDALRLGYENPAVLLALAKIGKRHRIDIMSFVESKARHFLRNRRFKKALGGLRLTVKGEK
jgi:Flp pilus assembly protein TadD